MGGIEYTNSAMLLHLHRRKEDMEIPVIPVVFGVYDIMAHTEPGPFIRLFSTHSEQDSGCATCHNLPRSSNAVCTARLLSGRLFGRASSATMEDGAAIIAH